MNIVILALLAGLITFIIFYFMDKRKKKSADITDAEPAGVFSGAAKVNGQNPVAGGQGATKDGKRVGKKEAKKGKKAPKVELPAFNEVGLPIYDQYLMSKSEKLAYSVLAGLVLFGVGYLFYMNVIISLIVALGGIWFPKLRKEQIIEKRKRNLKEQFKQALASISSSLTAGRSVENSFKAALDDLLMLYPNPNTDIVKEINWIVNKVQLNEPLEKALIDFAERANIEDITSFAQVFVTCKRTGGDLIQVIRNTSNIIQEKIEIENEIYVALAAKKAEQKVLMVVPLLVIGYLAFGNQEFMAPMYSDLRGRIVMTFGWIIIGAVGFITTKMMDIKV